MEKTQEKQQEENKHWFLKQVNESDKPLVRLIKIKKREREKRDELILRTKGDDITEDLRYNKDNKCYKQLHTNKFHQIRLNGQFLGKI